MLGELRATVVNGDPDRILIGRASLDVLTFADSELSPDSCKIYEANVHKSMANEVSCRHGYQPETETIPLVGFAGNSELCMCFSRKGAQYLLPNISLTLFSH